MTQQPNSESKVEDHITIRSSCELFQCDWKEVYYGYECRKCGTFVPFGCEPWATEEDVEEDSEWN